MPINADIALLEQDELHDCFGRTRHKDHRDDMDGVGTILKPCRTLYVGGLDKAAYKSPKAMEKSLWKHFGEFGELENINLISRLSICFVRYRCRAGCEFAKVSMGNQPLDKNEILNLKWAYDDPNPVAKDAASRADADAVMNMLQARGVSAAAAPQFPMAPDEYEVPAPKRQRTDGRDYPDTDGQCPDPAAVGPAPGPAQVPAAPPAAAPAGPAAWREVADEATGRAYWYDEATGESRWEAPPGAAEG